MNETREPVPEPLFRRHLRRPRLTALLDETTAQAILLVAPAGYGKTTLAREWAQARERVAWYAATSADADLAAFSADLADTLATIVPGAGDRVHKRLRAGGNHHELARPLAEILAEDLDPWPDDALVVVDDYHLIAESAPVEAFLDRLLDLTRLRLLVTTRRRPGWANARRLLHGHTVEIGPDHLAMTTQEAEAVLTGRPSEAVADLVRRAEGWPAVIGLAAVFADLDLPHGKVADTLFRYLAEEVLRREPPDVQRFMLLASVPATIDPGTARDVLDTADPEPILERLQDEDLLHPAAGELRFHPLLREFLRHRFREEDGAGYAESLERIADHARRTERWDEAFTLTLELGRADEAAEIAGHAARALLASGQHETLERWLDACGPAGITVPAAALARAELLVRVGEGTQAAALAEETLRRLPDDHPDYAWGSSVAGRALHLTGDEDLARRRFESGRRAARSDDMLKEALWGLVRTNAELAPDTVEPYLDELESRFGDDLDVRLRIAVGFLAVSQARGSLAGQWPRFQTLLPSLEHSRDPLAASDFLTAASWVAVSRGRFALGHELAVRTIRFSTELHAGYYDDLTYLLKAAAEVGLRRLAEAERSLAAFERSRIRRGDPHFRVEGLRRRAALLATRGSLAEAIATRDELPAHLSPRALSDYLGTLSIIHAAAGDTDAARTAAADAKAPDLGFEAVHDSALGDMIAAGIDGDASFQERAVEVVLACGRADYAEGLVLAYRLHPPLLEVAHLDAEAHAILRTALAHSHDRELARQAGIEIRPADRELPHPTLTPRETEVLALLAQGLTNTEIAEQLFIAPSTAKVHVHHILDKLGVRNRLQAVLRAQELLGFGPTTNEPAE